MAKGQRPSEASQKAWEKCRKFGQISYGISFITSLILSNVLTLEEGQVALEPLRNARERFKPPSKSAGITPE